MSGGTLLDLHVHTTAGSADAALRVARLGELVRAAGLDGVLVCEHFRLWSHGEVEAAQDAQGIVIIPAREWSTPLGHILAIGLRDENPALRDPARLREVASMEGAVLVAAHPFRHFFDAPRQGLHPAVLRTEDPEEAATLPIFSFVEAIETANGNCSDMENEFARRVAEVLRLPGTGGSDAHYPEDVGRKRTRVLGGAASVRELIAAIRTGALAPLTAPAEDHPGG